MNFPLQSWVDTLSPGSEVTYHYSLGRYPGVIESKDQFGIWVLVETPNNPMLAKLGTDGRGPYSSFITRRDFT
jgi:hypothetical protein